MCVQHWYTKFTAVEPVTTTSMMLGSPLSPQDAAAQLTTFKSYVSLIADNTPGSKTIVLRH